MKNGGQNGGGLQSRSLTGPGAAEASLMYHVACTVDQYDLISFCLLTETSSPIGREPLRDINPKCRASPPLA